MVTSSVEERFPVSKSMTRAERHWILYDVANSAFVLLATTVIPIYFASLAPGSAVVAWGYAETVASLVVALLMPILGSLADFKGNKLKFLIGFFGTGVVACLALALPLTWVPFILIYIVASIAFSSSTVFYDAMLVDVTTDDRMDMVSSHGYAWGYVGSTIPFIICIAIIFLGPQFGLETVLATRVSFVITAAWWFVFTIPLIRSFEQTHYKERIHGEVRNTLHELKSTLRKIYADKAIFLFMIAFFFYIDGVHTVIKMATTYGTDLGIDSTQLILALLVTQFVAFPSAIIYGRLAKRFGTRKMIVIAVVAYTLIVLFAAFFLKSAREFWMLAILVGLFQGGIQALSRSYFGRLVPKEHSNEFFGFFDIFGKYAAVLGTLLVAGITHLTGIPQLGILSVAILFVVGLVILLRMPATRADLLEAESR